MDRFYSTDTGYSGEIQQIIVITDGKSNMGISPADAAGRANRIGITVSVIGIIDRDENNGEKDIEEVEGIAKAGGGLCEYTHLENLGRTMNLVTRRTAQKTIEQIVSRQLKSMMGVDIEKLEPRSRFKIVDFIEKYGESIDLKCIVVLDTSGSMKSKLATAKKNLLELLEHLKTRKGKSYIAVITYPGEKDFYCSICCNFTDEHELLKEKLEQISTGGGTPTGPAIERACELMLMEAYEEPGDKKLLPVENDRSGAARNYV